ncbi:MAG TPA: MlaD family protein, partial [Acidimicrobiales bacterium]|nr:MlaD family protein [Acidimicrobiales bacterium]
MSAAAGTSGVRSVPRGGSRGRGWWHRSRLLRVAAVAVAAGAVLAGCSASTASGSPSTERVSATFANVGDLVAGAPVQVSGVRTGKVTSVKLAKGYKARVTMAIPASAQVPADVKAVVRRPTLLGQDVVDLEPQGSGGPPLGNGAVIQDTSMEPGLEQLVQAGSNVFGSISTSELSNIIHEGAVGYGGKGPQLHALLGNLDTVVSGYASHTAAIDQIIHGLNKLNGAMA